MTELNDFKRNLKPEMLRVIERTCEATGEDLQDALARAAILREHLEQVTVEHVLEQIFEQDQGDNDE